MKLYQTRDVIGRVTNPNGQAGHVHSLFPAKRGDPLYWTPLLGTQLVDGKKDDYALIIAGCTLSVKVFVKNWNVEILADCTDLTTKKHYVKGQKFVVNKPLPDFFQDHDPRSEDIDLEEGERLAVPVAPFKLTTIYGSAMLRCMLMLSETPQPEPYNIAPRPPGILCGLGSGTNATQNANLTPYQQYTRPDVVQLPWDKPFATLLIAAASDDAISGDFVEAYATSKEYCYLSALLF